MVRELLVVGRDEPVGTDLWGDGTGEEGWRWAQGGRSPQAPGKASPHLVTGVQCCQQHESPSAGHVEVAVLHVQEL